MLNIFKCHQRFKNYSKNINVDGQMYKLRILDTGGRDEFKLLRPEDYAGVSNK